MTIPLSAIPRGPRILAIDPGTHRSGWVILDERNRITRHATTPNPDLVENLRAWPAAVAIEWIEPYGKTVGREVFDTCRWVGRMQQAAPLGATLVGRRQVATALHARGDKNIRQALVDLLGPLVTVGLVGDQWSALAVAVTTRYHQETPHA